MLAIIRGLKEWRHYLEGLDYFEIHSDHDSLQWWKRAQDLTRRQARWTLYLSRFHFKLIHKPGKNMGRADGLSRKAEYAINDGDDNKARVVLTPAHFARVGSLRGHQSEVRDNNILKRIRNAETKDKKIAEALKEIEDNGLNGMKRGLENYKEENGLILVRGKIYVPNDETIRRDLVNLHHDNPAAGHPGIWKTMELISRNYWWPSMKKFVSEYVETCDTCNRNKTYPSKRQGQLKPHDVPDRPWEQIAIDYITHLLKGDGLDSKGHTAILTVTNLGVSKQVHFIPAYDEDYWE